MAGRYFFLICLDTSEGRLDNDRLSTGFVYAVSQSATTGNKLMQIQQQNVSAATTKQNLEKQSIIGFWHSKA